MKKFTKSKMANKPVDVTAKIETVDVCSKFDYVIVPVPFSIRCENDLKDLSTRTGLGTCYDYIKRLKRSTMSKTKACVATDIICLMANMDLGLIKTPTVICPQCHGLPQDIQEFLMVEVTELHDRGVNVIFVKDGIEFRAEEEPMSVMKRALQHVGLTSAF